VYLVWLSRRQVRAASEGSEDADIPEGVAERIVVLGVCLAVLLANPLGTPSPELLADSAVAAARIAPPQSPVVAALATRGIVKQNGTLAGGTIGVDAVARRRIAELSDSLAAARARLVVLDATLAQALQGAATKAALADVERAVDSLRQRALLFVLAPEGPS